MNNWFTEYGRKKIYKGKDGRWCYDFTCNGRRVRKIVGLSKAEAEEAMWIEYQRLKKDKFGLKEPLKNILFEDFAEDFLKNYSKINKRSWERDDISLGHLISFFKGRLLSNIPAELIERYKAKRSEEVKPATINRELACLKTLFNKAVEWGKLEFNPASRVKRLKENNFREKILNEDEMRRLVEAAKPNLKPVLIIALNTGMRRSEILSLKWKNVRFQDRYIFIEDSKSGKTRNIPMNGLVFETLKALPKEHDYIFYNPETKTCIKDIKTAFKTACRRAKIKGLRLHDLRHTAASAMVRNGIDLVTVSKILGHASIQMTMRYAHPTPENMQKAVNTLENIFIRDSKKNPENSGKNLGTAQIVIPASHLFIAN